MRDAQRDVRATQRFLERREAHRRRPQYSVVLNAAHATLEALIEFRDTVESLTPSERAQAEASAPPWGASSWEKDASSQ